MMETLSAERRAGNTLRRLIQENFPSQEAFAAEYGLDIRTVNRYINEGISKIPTVQELADFFRVDFIGFFTE